MLLEVEHHMFDSPKSYEAFLKYTRDWDKLRTSKLVELELDVKKKELEQREKDKKDRHKKKGHKKDSKATKAE